jgi:hypothetical protein
MRRYFSAVLAAVGALALATTLVSRASASVVLSPLPPLPQSASLATDFPPCQIPETNKLPELRRCRGDLEWYRQATLERYNTRIQQYIAALKKEDSALQILLTQQKISTSDYAAQHEKIGRAFAAAAADGELLDDYYRYLSRYRERSTWVIAEILIAERPVIN